MTQKQRILAYINEFGSITPMEAFADLGITKLATRISEIDALGRPIHKEWENGKNRYGETIRYMRYSLEDNNGGICKDIPKTA